MSTPRTFIGLYLLFLASVTSLDLSHTPRLRRDSQDGVIKDDNSKAKNTLVKLSKDDFGEKLKDVLEGHKRHNDKDDNIQAFHLLFEELDELADQLPDDLYDFDITRYISQTSSGPKQAALHDLCLKNSTRLRIFLSQVHETISSVLDSVNDDLHKTSRDKDELTTDNDYTATIQPTVTDDDSKEDDSTVTRALVSSQPSDDNSRDRDSFDIEDVFEKLSEDSMECLSAFFDDDDEKFLCRQFSHQSTRVFSTLIQAGAQCTTLLDDDDDDDDDDDYRTIPTSNGVNVRFQHHDEFETFFRHSFSQSNTFFDTGEDDGEDLDDGHQRVLLHQFMKTTPPSNWTSQDLRRALVFTSDVLDDDFLKDLSDDLFDDNLSLLGKVATRHRANPALQLAFRQRVLAVRQLDQLDSSAITSLGRGLLALSEDDFDDLNPLAILNANLKDLFDDINDHTHDDDDDDDDDRVRLALGHRMRQANVTGKDVGKLARFLYDDLVFMESVDADDLFENVKELDDLDLDDDQAAFLFRRVSQAPSFPSLSQFTRTQIQHLKPVLPGMGLSMLQQLPVAVVKESLDVFKDIDFGESQARELLDEILDFEPQEMTSKYFRSIGHLARGLDTDDIDDLDDDVISEVLDDIDDIDFNDAQKRLFADKARHLRNQPGVLALLKLPGFSHAVSIDDIDDLDDDEIVSTLNISTKIDWRPTQASALLVKVKESKVRGLRPSDLPGLGTLARGLLPRDLDDMLERSDDIDHIADVLGDREDDLSSSVVDNLVEKIIDSDYSDDTTGIRVTATYVAQKGAFLPYLSKDDFNKLEFDDDGKDAFVALMSKHNTNKLPRGQLHFLAENLLDMMKVKEDQDTADSRKLRLLGEFVLGLPAENLKAFSALAILNNLGTLGTLPFTRLQARVLLDKLDSVRKDWHCRATILASVGPLLQHADDDDIKNLCDEGLASSMSVIQRRMQQHHERVEERHEEGLWREDTLDLDTDDEIDKQTEDDDRKKQLVNRMILAAIDITSTGRRRRAVSKLTCSILRQMRQDVVLVEVQRLISMEKTEFHDCLEVLGNASKWDSNALASLVKYAKEVFGPPSTWTNERIRQAGALIAGLSVDEIRTLNITGVDALYSVGRHALLSVPQLMAGLNKWLNLKYAADVSKIRPGEFSALSEFVCGLTPSQIANLSRDAFKQSLDVIGHARSCTPDQVKAYVHLAMDVYNTSVAKWPPAVVGEMGILIGGMSSTSIHEMTKDQLALVTPSVIAKLPQTVLKEISEVQLSNLSTNQINSLSRSQYDALTPSQKKIVDAKATVAFTQATGTTTMQPGSAPVTDVGMTRQNNDSSLLTQSTVLQTPTTSPRASSVMIENKSFPSSQLPKVEVPASDMGELHQNGIQKATDLKSTMSQFHTPPPPPPSSQTQKEVPMTYSTHPSVTDIIRRIEIQSPKPVPAESGKASPDEITTQKTSGLPTSHKLQTISLKVVPTRVTHEVVPSSNQTTPGNNQAASEKPSEALTHSPARSSSVKSVPAKTDTENRFNAHSSTADVSSVSSSSRQETSGNEQGSHTASGTASQHCWGMVALLAASLLQFLLS